MAQPNEGRLIDFIKDGIAKGYDEETLRKMMREHGVPEEEIGAVIEEAEKELAEGAAEEFSREVGAAEAQPPIEVEEETAEEAKPAPESQPEAEPKEEMAVEEPGKRDGLYSALIIAAGFAAMLAVYAARMFNVPEGSTGEEVGIGLRLIKGLWPILFPAAANVANYVLFRRHFRLMLIISLIAMGVLLAAAVVIYLII